jgi:hypothetical protein
MIQVVPFLTTPKCVCTVQYCSSCYVLPAKIYLLRANRIEKVELDCVFVQKIHLKILELKISIKIYLCQMIKIKIINAFYFILVYSCVPLQTKCLTNSVYTLSVLLTLQYAVTPCKVCLAWGYL